MQTSLIMYMVYHDEASKAIAKKYAHLPFIKLIQIPNTPFMETSVFPILYERRDEWKNTTHVGILKYSFEDKTPFYDFVNIITSHPQHDVFTFVNGHEPPNNLSMIQYATLCHPLFSPCWYLILSKMGYKPSIIYDNSIPAFYSNYWIAKTHYFASYLNFITEAMNVMQKEKELSDLLYHDANYLQRLPTSTLERIMDGRPYYTHHCFIAERLPCFFFHTYRTNVYQVGGKERLIYTKQ